MKTLQLKNFQSHKSTTIDFAPTLTCLVGKSNHGKSAIIRAIKKVRDNKPLGSKFIRHGTTDCSVTVDDVHLSIGKNTTYSVEGTTFKALRGAVPEEVTEALNIGPESIQEQHYSIFLLDLSPGKVAEKLSSLLSLQEATDSLAYIKSKKTRTQKEIDTIVKSIEAQEAIVDELEFIDRVDEAYTKIERKRSKIERLGAIRVKLLTACKNAITEQSRLNELPNIANAETELAQLETIWSEKNQLEKHKTAIKEIIFKSHAAERQRSFDPSNLLTKATQLIEILEREEHIVHIIRVHTATKKNIQKLKGQEEELTAQWQELHGEECPTCGGTIGGLTN
jgi:exonuclease SbcC